MGARNRTVTRSARHPEAAPSRLEPRTLRKPGAGRIVAGDQPRVPLIWAYRLWLVLVIITLLATVHLAICGVRRRSVMPRPLRSKGILDTSPAILGRARVIASGG
jgi:hypothetical protein